MLAGRLPSQWERRCAEVGLEVTPEPVDGWDWVALDGYAVTEADQQAARRYARRVVVIDDHETIGVYTADLVVDQNVGAESRAYHGASSHTTVLRGPKFALLRREFRTAVAGCAEAARRHGRRVAISLGGHPSPSTRALVASVGDALVSLEVETVALEGRDDVARVLVGCDEALAAAGSTAYELCCVGVPAVLFAVADNQEPVGTGLAQHGAAVFLGPVESVDPVEAAKALQELLGDPNRLAAASRAGRRLVDGRGAARVVAAMRARQLHLRPARLDDAALLWRWVNDPEVRRHALRTDPIGWDEHLRWFRSRHSSPDTILWIAELDGSPIGQLRLDVSADRVEMDYSVDVGSRGAGWGAAILVAGRAEWADKGRDLVLEGVVKEGNVASHESFLAAGFDPCDPLHAGLTTYREAAWWH